MTMVVIRVTLFGDSAGAASAGHLMLSQEATGLFHQVFNPMKGAKPDLSKDLSYQISVQFVFSYFYIICIALHCMSCTQAIGASGSAIASWAWDTQVEKMLRG